MRILVVEDESIIIKIIEKLLDFFDEQITFARNGLEGLKHFKEETPDLVISDIYMPNMNGIEMAREIRKINKKTPIIFITSLDDPQLLSEMVDVGVEGFIPKPINKKLFIETIAKVTKSVNISKKLAIQEQLLNQYKLAVDKTTLVSKTDTKGVITYVNDAFVEISGYDRDELIASNHNIVRHPDMPKDIFKSMWETIKKGENWNGTIKNQRKDKSFYIVDANIFPLKDINGDTYEYLAIRHDITEQENYKDILEKQLDVSVQGLNEKIKYMREYEKAIDEANAFTRIDLDGNITFVNGTFRELLQCKKGEYKNQPLTVLLEKKNVLEKILEETKAKRSIKLNLKYINKENSFHAISTFIPILDVHDDVLEIMGIHQDVSEMVHLHQDIIDTQKEVVQTLGSIGESRSKETGLHVKRVAEYSKLLALKYGLSEEDSELIKMASPMHDIGKVGIPDAILNKPGKLTEDEFEIMKTHATLGYNMLQYSDREILKASATIAYTHHERWNGKGYPRGLKGEEIPIFGRITAVADVFDALGHDRVYKKAWELERILDLFKEERGEHFDPNLIDLFINNLDDFLEIKKMFDEMEEV